MPSGIDDLPPPPSASAGIDDLPPPPARRGPSQEETALREGASGITGGFDDEITGALGAGGRIFGVKNLGSWKPLDPTSHLETTQEPLSADQIAEAYRSNRDAVRGQQAQDMSTNPGTTIAANLGGAFISPIGKIGAGAALGEDATRAQRLAQAMKAAATQGAVYGAGASNADLTKGDVGGLAKDTALGAATGAVIPPAVEGAVGAAKSGAQVAGWASKKLFSSAFGVSEENAAQYLARRAETNAAPELATIKDGVDGAVKQLGDAVDSGKMKVSDAHDALADLKTTVRIQLVDAKVDARDAVRKADSMFQEAAANAIQPLKDIKAPTARAADAADMVGALKDKVQGASGQALETLNNSGAKVDLSRAYSAIDDAVSGLNGAGTDEAHAVASKLQDYKTRLMTQNWGQIEAPQAKKLIQGLDKITAYSPMQGAFDDVKNQAFKGVRSALDQSLKESVPEYAAEMAKVAPDAALLSKANDAFGTPEKAVGTLGRLNTPRGEFDRATLAQMEQATGRSGAITADADRFSRAQAILKDPQAVDAIKRALPEYDAYRGAMAKLAKMNPQWGRDQLELALSKSKEARALSLAEDAASKAQQRFAPVTALTPSSTEAKIKSFGHPSGAPIETQRALGSLDKSAGTNFTQQIKDRALLDDFQKPYSRGARNVALGSVLGLAFSHGGLEGLATGGAVGSLIDRYGPRVGKAILDGIDVVRQNPTVQTIRSLSLPNPVKRDLERELTVYMTSLRGPDRWAQSGAQSVGLKDEDTRRLMATPQGKRLLIQASDLKPGSKAMQNVQSQIQEILKGTK